MKKKLLTLSFLLSINCFSQITGTWYLENVQATDLSTRYVVPNISPAVSLSLTLNADFTFTAQGACNTMTGTWTSPFDQTFVIATHNTTTNTCSAPIHNDVESNFFGFLLMNMLQYHASVDGTNLMLTSALMGQAQFRDTQLQSPGFDVAQVSIYPNPAHSTISLNSGNAVLTKIEFINSLGQSTKTINTNFETIDIADLPTGIYIMKISSDTGSANKKIIKI